ncbi:hypothetical protein BJ138DRAFT_500107 [Hygrophoropsis aurantiaca]|uniref:Uncharacterized protein n=1 Tax=Hygrophoropsis aurantiaca TaxID=72124 RepID=A0ACB8A2K8_9AGAM|nr:hypothetical protein BJ138DRAFT_500107 [Hygrophoropsis aurantiaca]
MAVLIVLSPRLPVLPLPALNYRQGLDIVLSTQAVQNTPALPSLASASSPQVSDNAMTDFNGDSLTVILAPSHMVPHIVIDITSVSIYHRGLYCPSISCGGPLFSQEGAVLVIQHPACPSFGFDLAVIASFRDTPHPLLAIDFTVLPSRVEAHCFTSRNLRLIQAPCPTFPFPKLSGDSPIPALLACSRQLTSSTFPISLIESCVDL